MTLRVLAVLDSLVGAFCKWGVILCLVGLSALLLLAVLVRLVPGISMTGYDEVIEWLFAWMSFVGTLALWREGSLYRVGFLDNLMSGWPKRLLGVFNQILMLGVALVFTVNGYEFMRDAGETMPFLRIDKSYWYFAIPGTGALMVLYSVSGIWRAAKGEETFAEVEAAFS